MVTASRSPGPGVLCYSASCRRTLDLARSTARTTREEVFVLVGYRRNVRGHWYRVYYLSLVEDPEIAVDGLPDPGVVGPPYSSPLLLEVVAPPQDLETSDAGGSVGSAAPAGEDYGDPGPPHRADENSSS